LLGSLKLNTQIFDAAVVPFTELCRLDRNVTLGATSFTR
jgi:hypothetical protein